MLRKIEPALAVEQSAYLHHPHIVVGVAEREPADRVPAIVDKPDAEKQPHEQRDNLPVPRQPIENALFYLLSGHLPHAARLTGRVQRASGRREGLTKRQCRRGLSPPRATS